MWHADLTCVLRSSQSDISFFAMPTTQHLTELLYRFDFFNVQAQYIGGSLSGRFTGTKET